jgi:CubicO group peptidase (beta-lactamase class C family)
MSEINGHADEGWGAVADAFRRNFDEHGEVGAACCVYRDGRPVVDLWGGIADRSSQRPWERDTIALVFSTTKGATAICAHMLVERGELDLDAPVVEYWPEYGVEGKEGTKVRWLLSHQAGLPGVVERLTLEEACAWDPVIHALERQQPLWEPGTRQLYHGLTYGFLVGEVVRRVAGKSIGRFFAEEVAQPLGLSTWIGLPEAEEPRVTLLFTADGPFDVDAMVDAMLTRVPPSVTVPAGAREGIRAHFVDGPPNMPDILGGAFPPELINDGGGHNARIVRASEHPGSGMVSDARSLARMYAATIGEVDGVRLLQPSTVEAASVLQPAPAYGIRPELEAFWAEAFPSTLALGFMRPGAETPLLGPTSFGHPGAGGSLAFGDPESNVAFGYVMNRMAGATTTANNLVEAVAASTAAG